MVRRVAVTWHSPGLAPAVMDGDGDPPPTGPVSPGYVRVGGRRPSPMPGGDVAQVGEREARRVAEAAREAEWRLPSFGKELFLGHLRLDLISPHPRPKRSTGVGGRRSWPSSSRSYRTRGPSAGRAGRPAARPGGRRAAADRRTRHEDPRGVRRTGAWPPCTTTGRLNCPVPGIRAFPRCSRRTSRSVWPSRSWSFGTAEQKRKYLPLVARKEISAFLLTEPDVGSDPARMCSQAGRSRTAPPTS